MNFVSQLFSISRILTCESPIKDLNGMESNLWKKLKLKSSKIFMEKTANVNLILKAISNVNAIGISKLLLRSTNHFKICEKYPSLGSMKNKICILISDKKSSLHRSLPKHVSEYYTE